MGGLRATLVGGWTGFGRQLPQGLSQEDELALLAFGGCEEAAYIYLELLKHMLGGNSHFLGFSNSEMLNLSLTEDAVSISWWRFRPLPSRRVWMALEAEEEYESDHSYLRVQMINGTTLAADFTGDQFAWTFEVMEAEEYEGKRCEEGTVPWEPALEDKKHHPQSYAAKLRTVVLMAVHRFCGGDWRLFDQLIDLAELEKGKEEERLLEQVRADVETFCTWWSGLMQQ